MVRKTYHPLQITLHWLIFALVLLAVPIGLTMTRREEYDAVTNALYLTHWSIGLTVLFLMTIRIATRIFLPAPRPAAGLAGWERGLSRTVHATLYVMLIVVPMLGWLGKSAFGAAPEGISVYGLFHVPVLIEKDEALAERLLAAHRFAVYFFLCLLALHVAGVLKHALARDGVTGRMGLGRRVAEPES